MSASEEPAPIPSREKPVYPLRWTERLAASPNALPLPRPPIAPERTVLLTGTGRSGTTWMAGLLAAAPDYCLVTEPLNPKMPGMLRAGFTFDTYRDPDEPWPEGERILGRYFRGRGLTVKLLHRNGLRSLTCDGLILKAIRANRILPWIAARFPLQAMILLLRHPCGVVSSQMAHLADRDPCWPDNLEYLRRRLPHLLPWAKGLELEEERRALTWALDAHAPLAAPRPHPWLTVTYEELVADGSAVLARVFEGGALPGLEAALDGLEENSWQVRGHSVDHGRATVEERLGVWRRRLAPGQRRRILSVVERVGVAGYGEGIMPRGRPRLAGET